MKKIKGRFFVVILAVMAALCMSGCGESENESDMGATVESSAEASEKKTGTSGSGEAEPAESGNESADGTAENADEGKNDGASEKSDDALSGLKEADKDTKAEVEACVTGYIKSVYTFDNSAIEYVKSGSEAYFSTALVSGAAVRLKIGTLVAYNGVSETDQNAFVDVVMSELTKHASKS